MTLVMTAPVRVFRTSDDTQLYADTFEYRSSGAHKFVEWAADDGLLFREEVDRGARSLAGDIARLQFPPPPSHDGAPAEQSSDEAAGGPSLPVSPKPGEATR